MKKSIIVFLMFVSVFTGCASASPDSDSGDSNESDNGQTDYVWYRVQGDLSWDNALSSNVCTGKGTIAMDLYFKNDETADTLPLAYYHVISELTSYGGSDGYCVVTPTSGVPASVAGWPVLDNETALHTDVNRLQLSFDPDQSLIDITLEAVIDCGITSASITDYPFYKLLAGLKTEDLVFDIESGIQNKSFSYDISDPSGTFYENMDFTVTGYGLTNTTEQVLDGKIEKLLPPIE